MIANTVCAGIGIALFLLFIGTIVWWVKPVPLAIIVLIVVVMMIYDMLLSLRDARR